MDLNEMTTASMRPRLITAENACTATAAAGDRYGFNEAAAHHRGEPKLAPLHPRRVRASMRPRLITAENGGDLLHVPAVSGLQ